MSFFFVQQKQVADSMSDESRLRIVMHPWFAMGHLTPFLHMANKLAARGHEVFFLLPTKTQEKLNQFNLHPQNIKFIPLVVPIIEGLPPGAETTSDIDLKSVSLLFHAMDLTQPIVESFLQEIKPHFVFFDYQHWLPSVTRSLGIKSIQFFIINPQVVAYFANDIVTAKASNLLKASPGFPSSVINLKNYEARGLHLLCTSKTKGGITFLDRLAIAKAECDAITFKGSREMEGKYCNFVEKMFNKPVILAGPVVPEAPTSVLEEKWVNWLNGFRRGEVIYCAFGSECRLEMQLFQELVLGFELTGLPFFAALKPPIGAKTVEEGLPGGFEERIRGRGIVYGGWVQQQLILSHPSVGCFVTHCGGGSISEALVSQSQIVFLPNVADQAITARMMDGELRVGVEIERDKEGLFTKEDVCNTIKLVMDEESEIGKLVKANHTKWREFLLTEGLENSYIDEFVDYLQGMLRK